jgi:hypothetical protein
VVPELFAKLFRFAFDCSGGSLGHEILYRTAA